MARKIDVKRILELKAAGMSRNTIAASRHASKYSVGDVFRIADEKGITCDSVAALSPGEVYRMFFPDRHSVETLYEHPDYGYVHKELMRVGVTLKLLWGNIRADVRHKTRFRQVTRNSAKATGNTPFPKNPRTILNTSRVWRLRWTGLVPL